MKKRILKQVACILSMAIISTSLSPVSNHVEAAAKMALNATAKTLYVGEKGFNFDVKNAPQGATQRWTISNSKVATVGNTTGFVTPKNNGKVTVKCTVTPKGKTPTVLKATVTVRTKAASVKITNLPEKIEVGETIKLGAEVSPDTTSNKAVKWYVDSKTKATIAWKTGELTGVKAGEKVKIACVADSNKAKAKATAYVEVVAATPKAKQLGAKTIQVDLADGLVKEITVKKGDSVVVLDANDPVSLSADGKTAIVKTASNMVAGEYIVEIKGVEAKAKFKVEASQFGKITIIGDKLVLNDDYGKATEAYVAYKVENQWGEDVSNLASIQATSIGTTTAQGGRVTVKFQSGSVPMLGTATSLVLVDTTTGLSTTATLTVAAKALPSEITVEGLYNVNDKKLGTDTNLNKDEFYVTFKAVDQHGNDIKDAKTLKDTLVVNVTDPTKVDFEKDSNGRIAFEDITVKGVKKLAIKAKAPLNAQQEPAITAGKTQVIFIPLGSGKSTTLDIEILEKKAYVDTITLMTPEYAIAHEDIIIPYVALNSYGEEVTDVEALKEVVLTPSNTFEIRKDYTTGKAQIVLPKESNETQGMRSVSTTTKSYKVNNITFTVQKRAYPVSVVGVTKEQTLAAINGGELNIQLENIIVQDNYGRTLSGRDWWHILIGEGTPRHPEYAIGFELMGGVLMGDPLTQMSDFGAISANSPELSEETRIIKTTTKDKPIVTEDIVFSIRKAPKPGDPEIRMEEVEGSRISKKVTLTNSGVKYESYKIETADNILVVTPAAVEKDTYYGNELKVIGVTSSGVEVPLKTDEYELILPSGLEAYDNKIDSKTLVADGTSEKFFTDANKSDEKKEVTITVVSNLGGMVEKKITICEEKPKATTLEFNKDYKERKDAENEILRNVSKMPDGTWRIEANGSFTVAINDANTISFIDRSLTNSAKDDFLIVKDQYGKVIGGDVNVATAPGSSEYRVIVENNDGHIDIQKGANGTSNVKFSTVPDKDAKVTIMIVGGPQIKATFVYKK